MSAAHVRDCDCFTCERGRAPMSYHLLIVTGPSGAEYVFLSHETNAAMACAETIAEENPGFEPRFFDVTVTQTDREDVTEDYRS